MSQYYFDVYGKVQKVMFRQTLMRAAKKRNLFAAASNDRTDPQHVLCYVEGDEKLCQEIMERIESGMQLNSWGAKASKLEVCERPESDFLYEEFEVNTKNVDDINWSEGVEFYL